MADDEQLEDEVRKFNTTRLHLGAFVLSNSRRILNESFHTVNGFNSNDLYYGHTNSLYIKNERWTRLDRAGLSGKILLHGENDYKDGGFFGLFLAP